MKRLNLNQRIWLSFVLLIFAVGFILAILFPLSIQGTLTEESYNIIKEQQDQFVGLTNPEELIPESDLDFIERKSEERSVGHLAFFANTSFGDGNPIPRDVLKEMAKHAYSQAGEIGKYEMNYQGASLLYLVRKISINGNQGYIVSYMWDTYQNELVQKLWVRLIWILGIAIVISIFPAMWLSGYLRKPIKLLGEHFEHISKRNWDTPFEWEGEDEFHELSMQFEKMRQNLIRNDQLQKTFIQHASHELKTPIMTIKSYAQAIKDGIMPKGTPEETMDVIIKQASRMEERVKDMLFFAKLDAIKNEGLEKSNISFGAIVEDTIDRFKYMRDDLNFEVEGHNLKLKVDQEQWKIVLENLIQNAVRYAKDIVKVEARSDGRYCYIKVYNNGENIDSDDLVAIFDPFQKGNLGQFGLGLAISKRIVELHHGKIWAENEAVGVSFIVMIPL